MGNQDYIVAVPIIIGIIEVLKRAGLPDKYAPITALVLGVAWSFAIGGTSVTSVFDGIVAGLSASGLYSGYKASVLQK